MIETRFALLLILGVTLLAGSESHAQGYDDDGQPARVSAGSDRASAPNAGGTLPGGSPSGGRGSLTTIFASNNGYAGNTFDITPSFDLVITSVDINISDAGAPFQLDFYWKTGTAVGYENDATAWTLFHSGTGTSAGTDIPSWIDLAGNGQIFPAGQTYGIYIDLVSYAGLEQIRYTNGGPTTYSNADLSLTTNTGQASPAFTNYFQYRIWNGTIYYGAGFNVPEDHATIQGAIDAAANGDVISVAPGTYHETIDFNGKAVRLFSRTRGEAVIDGSNADSVVTFANGEGSTSILDGFTITNGNSASGGGGIYCIQASPTIVNNKIENNSANFNGGGMYCSQGSPLVEGNTFESNSAESGGGAYFTSGSATIVKNTIENNSADDLGGGLYYYSGTPVIENNIICDNTVVTYCGGGVRLYLSSPTSFSNNLICGNRSDSDGGGIALVAETTLNNCTICDNRAANRGGGLLIEDYVVTVTDSIIWANRADVAGDQIWDEYGIGSITYSDVGGGWPGTGNIDSNPLFVRGPCSPGGDYYLDHTSAGQARTSPCVNAGSDSAANLGLDSRFTRTDHAGDSGTVDMGFHYFTSTLSVPADFGTIQAAIDAAATGEIVLVAPGTYVEQIDFKGKAIKVVSESGPESTIIDGAGSDGVALFKNGEGRSSILEGFTITNGNAAVAGGGIDCYQTSPSILNNFIQDNFAVNRGGGMHCSSGSPLIKGNHFEGNSAKVGGGIRVNSGSALILNNTFENNTTTSAGGGIYCFGGTPVIENNIIRGNSNDTFYGGGVHLSACFPTSFSNNLICENRSGDMGGGISSEGDVTLRSCTICNNTAVGGGGGVLSIYTTVTVVDSILWGNRSPTHGKQVSSYAGSVHVSYSDILGGWPLPGTGNIETDPLFVRGPYTMGGHFYLSQTAAGQSSTSPCVDAGSDTAANLGLDSFVTRTDHVGDSDTVDMGFHFTEPTIRIPDDHTTIQAGIDAAREGDLVLVAPGNYNEDIDFYGKAITVASSAGPHLTSIQGTGSGSVVSFTHAEGPRSVLSGFSVVNGDASFGGGIYCVDASPTIVNNKIGSNTTSGYGGGIYCNGSSSTITDNTIINNIAGGYGGGIYCTGGTPRIENNVITNNRTNVYSGGGVRLAGSFPASFANNLIYGNKAATDGGGISANRDLTILNCTVCSNEADRYGGGAGGASGCTLTITNSILWNNLAHLTDDQIYGPGTVSVSYSDVEGGWPGTGNIDAYPEFVHLGFGDFHLTSISPCIDAGDNAAPGLPSTDFEGDYRVFGLGTPTVDMGVDEFMDITLTEVVDFNATGIDGEIVVSWETAYEVDIACFHIWRSDKPRPEGDDFVRISTYPWSAYGDPSQGQAYSFDDQDVALGHPYSYKLEVISYRGESLFFGYTTARWLKSYLEQR